MASKWYPLVVALAGVFCLAAALAFYIIFGEDYVFNSILGAVLLGSALFKYLKNKQQHDKSS
jgi:uncharacterized membrane protein YjjP (DUF1212 family)